MEAVIQGGGAARVHLRLYVRRRRMHNTALRTTEKECITYRYTGRIEGRKGRGGEPKVKLFFPKMVSFILI